MAKKPGRGVCVHCLKEVEKRNWDHVLPVSWYPDTTPQNLEKWKIPTCKPCNDAYGKLEEDFGMLLSLCVNPNIPQSSGIYKKLVRAFDPSCGKNEKDRKAREKKRSALRQKLMHGEEIPDHGIYPGLDAKFDLPKEEQMAVPVPASYFERLGEKIVRGVTYIESGLFIDPQFSIKTHIVNEHGAVGFEEALHKFGQSLSCGPGIAVNRAMMEEDKIAGIYKITIWQEFILYLTVSPINIGA